MEHRFPQRLSKFLWILLPTALLLAAVSFHFRPRYDYPPVLRVADAAYAAPDRHTLFPQEDLVYLGEVTGVVPSDCLPEETLQSNHDLTGSVYRRPDGDLAVLKPDGLWYVYRFSFSISD